MIPRPTTRAELVEALTLERYGLPVPEYRNCSPTPAASDDAVLQRVALDLALDDDPPELDSLELDIDATACAAAAGTALAADRRQVA